MRRSASSSTSGLRASSAARRRAASWRWNSASRAISSDSRWSMFAIRAIASFATASLRKHLFSRLELRPVLSELALGRGKLLLALGERLLQGTQLHLLRTCGVQRRCPFGRVLLHLLHTRGEFGRLRCELELALVEFARACGQLAVVSSHGTELLLALCQQRVARLQLGTCLRDFLLEGLHF